MKRSKLYLSVVIVVSAMSHLRFYRAILSRDSDARQNRRCDMALSCNRTKQTGSWAANTAYKSKRSYDSDGWTVMILRQSVLSTNAYIYLDNDIHDNERHVRFVSTCHFLFR